MGERKPYQDPQTSMERHVAELVEHLQHGVDNRSGFAQRIEAAQAHAFWLENECERLRAENDKLMERLALDLPRLSFDGGIQSGLGDRPDSYITEGRFMWRPEPFGYAIHLRRSQRPGSPNEYPFMRKIRWRAVREICREVRAQVAQQFQQNGLLP